MKYIKKLFTIFALGSCVIFSNAPINAGMSAGKADKMSFSINDEDLDLLESMGFTRDQAKEMADMVNNLSPEEQQALAQIGQEIEKEMKNAGIDPNNPDDLFNYFSNLEQGTAPALPMPELENEQFIQPQSSKPVQPKVPAINPKASADITILLEELLSYIASLRQKASSSMLFSHKLEGPLKQELDELTYYLHVLTKEALKPFIIAKEATTLHKALLKLHEILATYEPLIQTKTSFEDGIDDPYKTLNIEFGATATEIKQTFVQLQAKYDPAIIEKQLIELGMNAKDIARKLKEAKLHFSAIKGAFESLSNPQEKAQIDKALMNRKIQKQESEALSEKAFTQCSSAITNAFYKENLIKQIQDLLAKYAPEEKIKADEWEKTMKATLENQKKLDAAAASRAKSSQTQGVQGLKNPGREDETGKRFWDSYRPLENKGGFKAPPKNFGSDKGPEKKTDGGSSGSKGGDSKGSGSKGGGAPSKKPDAKKDDKKSDGKKDAGKKITIDEKDFAKATSLATLLHPEEFEKLKKVAFKDDRLLQPNDYKQKDTIKNIFFDELPKALMLPYEAPKKGIEIDEENKKPSTLDKIDAFMKEYKLDAVAQDYAKLGKSISDAKKEEVDAFKPVWQSFAKDGKAVASSIKHMLQNSLGYKGLDNNNGLFVTRTKSSKINRSQLAHHQLAEEATGKAPSALKGPLKASDPGYLKYVKTTLTTIVEQFEKLDGKLGAKPEAKKDAPKPEAPKKETVEDKLELPTEVIGEDAQN